MLDSKKIFWLTYLYSIECKISPKLLRKMIFEQSIQGGFLDSYNKSSFGIELHGFKKSFKIM